MTDREDLDDQIWRSFVGCGVRDDQTPRAGSGKVADYNPKQDGRRSMRPA